MLATRFGLVGLLLEDGAVEEGGLKSILHALLVSGGPGDKESTGGKERGSDGVERLSLKGCKKIRENGWGLVAEYLKMVRSPFSPPCCLALRLTLMFFTLYIGDGRQRI